MKNFFAIILVFAIACSSLFGLMSHENEQFVQGKWQLSGEHKDENENSQSWFLEWEFKKGKFTKSGYPPLKQEGRYKVLEDHDNILKLKLYNQDGTFGTDESDLEIIVDEKDNKLVINGKSGFSKIEKKSA